MVIRVLLQSRLAQEGAPKKFCRGKNASLDAQLTHAHVARRRVCELTAGEERGIICAISQVAPGRMFTSVPVFCLARDARFRHCEER